jgi:DNA-directed RNA polymerase subunit F
MTVVSKAHEITSDQIKGRRHNLENIMNNCIEHLGLFGMLHEPSAQN